MPDYTRIVKNNLHRFKQLEAFLPFDNPTFDNPAFQDASYRVLIVRLSPFRDVDRSLPHLFLFSEIRGRKQEAQGALPDVFIDVAFLPSAIERELFDQIRVPYLIGTQSLRSADEFDLVLISNAYTLELINLPYLLIHSDIPLFASQRGHEWPILILGGSNAMAAQSIIRPNGDALVDGIFFGEGEGWVGNLVTVLSKIVALVATQRSPVRSLCRRWRNRRADKRRALEEAAEQVDGLWTAGALRPVTKAALCEPEARFLPVEYPLLNSPEVHTANLQINYGCPAFCSFCFEGYDRKPYREIPLPDLLSAARQIKRAQGVEELNLYSFNFNTQRDILPLLLELHRLYERVSFKSQRVDVLEHAGYLLEAEVEADKRSFTLGIEGISERQRAWLHKSLSTEDVVALLDRLLAYRIREVKLFYVLTGHETDDDIAEFRQFLKQLKAIHRSGNRGIRMIFSFGLLIRMPFTPLRYDRLFLDEGAWRPLIGQVKSACETNGFEFRLAFDWPTYCTTQVLALGGYWLVEQVVALARKGYCFDTALPPAYWDELERWMVREGHWSDAFLDAKGVDHPFALEFVQSNVPPAFLYRQYQQARSGVDSGYCLGSRDRRGRCLGCGACVDEAQREAITHHQTRLPDAGSYMTRLRETVAHKRRLRPVYFLLRLDPPLAGVWPAFLNAFVFRGLLALCPELVENLLSVRESLFTLKPNNRRFPTMSGETVFALKAWDAEALQHALSEPRESPEIGFQIVGPAEEFTPGAFTRLHLDLHLPGTHFDEPRRKLEQYLRDAYLPYSLRRGGARYRFHVPEKGLKKKVIFDGFFEIGQDGFTASLDVGGKFDLMAFLGVFDRRNLHRYARAQVSEIQWGSSTRRSK